MLLRNLIITPVYYIPIIILVLSMTIVIIVLVIKNKNKCETKTSKKCNCPNLSTASYKIPSSLRPTKYTGKESDNIIQISKLNYTNLAKKGNMITLSSKPIYFEHGLRFYIDNQVQNIPKTDINHGLNEITTKEKTKTKTKTPHFDLSVLVTHLNTDITNLNTGITKVTTIAKIIEKYKNNLEHYISLISIFVAQNPSMKETWKDILNYLGAIMQGKMPAKFPKKDVPDMNQILDWVKYSISKLGGMSAILHRFRKRIKYDFIQAIANTDGYRTKSNTTKTHPSGYCTVFPLTWWQNCTQGTVPAGYQGWGKDPKTHACHRWYEHLSGELICSDIVTHYDVPVGNNCQKILNLQTKLTDKDVQHNIGIALSTILAGLSLIPSAAPVIKIIAVITKIYISINSSDFSWLLNDLKDVCNNFTCNGATSDTACPNHPSSNSKCCPPVNDKVLAERDCLTSYDCNTKPAGTCKDSCKSSTVLASMSILSPTYYNISDFI